MRSQKIIIDTTPGHKYISAFAPHQGQRIDLNVEKLYYNHMLDQRYLDVPHPIIPRHEQQLYDFLASNIAREYSIRWELLCQLISLLRIIYGRIDLHLVSSGPVYIYDIWRQKRAEDRDQDHVGIAQLS